MLGKCHLKLGDRDTAIDYLKRAINYPKFTEDDHQVNNIIHKYSNLTNILCFFN